MVAGVEGTAPDVVLTHPNRDKASSQTMRVVMTLLLVVSAVALLVVIIGGWDKLVGMKALQLAFVVVFLVMAFFVARWNRGVLPLAAALATLLAIFAAISAPQWLARDKAGFTSPTLDDSVLGIITLLIVVLQLVLIVAALIAFRQEWSVELEVPATKMHVGSGGDPHTGPPGPAPAAV